MSTPSVTPRGGVAAALVVVYIAWGSTFVAMRVAVRSLPPLTMSGVRFLAAGLLLYGWCLWQRHRHPEAGWRAPTRREWRASAILGIALPAAGTGGAAWAEQKIPAGTAALLLATVPVWMIITSRIVDNERITILTAGGLVLGLAGVAVLINPLAGAAPDPFASAVALGGALCWGCGSVYAKRAPHPSQPLLASGMEMICAGVALGLIGAAGGELGRVSVIFFGGSCVLLLLTKGLFLAPGQTGTRSPNATANAFMAAFQPYVPVPRSPRSRTSPSPSICRPVIFLIPR